MDKESTYKKKIEYNQRVHKLCCKNGKYYCRAVHAILDTSKHGVICGKGCPCFARIDDDGGIICEYYDLNVNITACTPKQNKQRAQVLIDAKVAPLFPNVWLKEGSRKTIMEKAFVFAAYEHKKQVIKNSKSPYGIHLVEVANVITQLTSDVDVMVAGILHDIIEETSVSKKEIEEKFGKKVADIVIYGCEEKKLDKAFKNREWQDRYIDKLKKAPKEVKILAFADTLSNLERVCKEYNIKNEKILEDNDVNEKNNIYTYYKKINEEVFEEFKGTEPFNRYMENINKLSSKI